MKKQQLIGPSMFHIISLVDSDVNGSRYNLIYQSTTKTRAKGFCLLIKFYIVSYQQMYKVVIRIIPQASINSLISNISFHYIFNNISTVTQYMLFKVILESNK